MQLYRDQAIVLGHYHLGEADKIIKLLTRSHGLIRAVAKGIRRTRSKFGAHLEPFSYVDLQLHQGRNLEIITQAKCLQSFTKPLSAHYGRYTCACGIIETAERLSRGDLATTAKLHHLTLGALQVLSTDTYPHRLILDAYLIRAMTLTGWAPSLSTCVHCGRPGPHEAFHIPSGGVLCHSCRPLGARRVPPGTIELIEALQKSNWAYALASTQGQRYSASRLIVGSLQWHTEKYLRTLAFIPHDEDLPLTPPEPIDHQDNATNRDDYHLEEKMIDTTHPLIPTPLPFPSKDDRPSHR